MILPDSPLAAEVVDLVEQGVTIKAGRTCFEALEVPLETLPGVDLVPSGVSEVVKLQSTGYNYVKVPRQPFVSIPLRSTDVSQRDS